MLIININRSLYNGIHFLNIFHDKYEYCKIATILKDVITDSITYLSEEESLAVNNLMNKFKSPYYEIHIERENRFEMELLVLPILREFVKKFTIYIIARKETRKYWFNSIYCYITRRVCIIDSIKCNIKIYFR